MCKKTKAIGARCLSEPRKEELYGAVLSKVIGEIPSINGWWYRIPCFDYKAQLKESLEFIPSMGSLFGIVDSLLVFILIKMRCLYEKKGKVA